MTIHLPGMSKGEEMPRQRRSHKKSRQGCRNCKLRRVKCDETKPQCQKCMSFQVSCNYDPSAADLQMSFYSDPNPKSHRNLAPAPTQELRRVIISPYWQLPAVVSNSYSSLDIAPDTLDYLRKFQNRTVLTIGTIGTSLVYQDEVTKLAFMHPYLMHVIHTLTATHDRYLSSTPSRATKSEVYHWSRAAALFNLKLSTLSMPLGKSDRDALWATAALLGVISFSFFDASFPYEAWPLNPDANLDWLRMCEGKSVIWKLADPLGHDSVFQHMAADLRAMVNPTECSIEAVPRAFINLYELHEDSPLPVTPEINPYRAAVFAFSALLHVESTQSNTPKFFSFITHLQPDFRTLLEKKDPRALLLLACWYAKICHSQWWVARRALLECQATCIYLERLCESDEMEMEMRMRIRELLELPRSRCILAPTGTYRPDGWVHIPLAVEEERNGHKNTLVY